jgi:hypothetical protein
MAQDDDKTNRRDVLSLTAGAVASLAIAPAAYAANDPIFAAIKKHHDAATAHDKAVEIEFAFEEECGSTELAEKCQQYRDLREATGEAFFRMQRASVALGTTRPTTLVGIAAVLWHVAAHMEEEDSPGMVLENHFGSTQKALAIFCENMGTAVAALAAGDEEQLRA